MVGASEGVAVGVGGEGAMGGMKGFSVGALSAGGG